MVRLVGSSKDEESTVAGVMNMFIRNIWDSMAVELENVINGENNITTLYDIKNLKSSTDESGSSGTGGYEIDVDGFVHYYQSDYAYVPYCEKTLAERGCGPTAFAMVATTILGKSITPEDAVTWCGRTYSVDGVGTLWSYFAAAKKHFNLPGTITETGDINQVVAAMKTGALVISSQGPGLFTTSGHFIVLAYIDDNEGIVVKDPSKNNAVNKGYNGRIFSTEEINEHAKNYWIFSR